VRWTGSKAFLAGYGLLRDFRQDTGRRGQRPTPSHVSALLTERFRLAAHKEDRPRPGYALL